MNTTHPFSTFATQIGVPVDRAEDAAAQIGPILFERFLMHVDARLYPSDRELAVQFIDNDDLPGLLTFLKDKIPDLNDILAHVLRG